MWRRLRTRFAGIVAVSLAWPRRRPCTGRPVRRKASGGPTEVTSATRATPPSIRSPQPTSASSKWPGASRPITSVRASSSIFNPRRSWLVAGCIRPAARGAPSSRWTPRPASCSGCTAKTRARAAPPRRVSCPGEGLAYWTDGKEERILYVTPGYRLVALDARTGNRVALVRQRRHRRSQGRSRSQHGSDDRARWSACHADRRR